MNNYEKIETYLKHNLHVLVKYLDEDYEVISPTKDEWGDYRTSGSYSTLEEAKQCIGQGNGFCNLEEACKDFTEITPFHLDFEPYPVGMKVKVIKTGEVGEIGQISCNSMYFFYGHSTQYAHTELIPYFEEEVEKSISSLEMTIKQIEEKLNITGLKIVK